MALNQQSPVPLYRQLANRIRDDIDSGLHAVAQKIPSENELAQKYGIGRPTVRQATDLLVRQGKLERRRGSGTYVLPPNQSIDMFSLAGTSAALRKSELNARLELVSTPIRERIKSDNTASEFQHSQSIKKPSDERTNDEEESVSEYLRVERRALVDGTPVLFETLWLSTESFPDLENHNLANQSLSALVRDVYFLEPSSADQTFCVITADKTQAKQLQTPTGTPLLRVYRQLHFADHKNALHAEIVCLTDRFEFSQTLFPANAMQESEKNH